ncbi:MAG: 3-hydroxyacyl-CoA dehydrogenase NAD-binding domain-containing protein [Sphingobium sp.]|uniref:3-hydroxyacyl-CoA dehydrogenase NAD-binding domain-containing protein n=1 Tax=Sphingobium sp. TaxID=1912891 RepID=UPI002E1DF1F2
MEIRRNALIAIVGAGTMGAGIAQVAAAAGHSVVILDTSADALARGQETVAKSLAGAVKRGKIDAAEASAIEARMQWTTDRTAAAPAALVIEAIIERLDAKVALFRELESIVAADTILASNTSSLSIGAIAATLDRPERFIGLHYFNPVPAMPLVETISASTSSATVAEAATSLMRAWGKTPVAVRDVPGFIVNRVARPYYAEGFAALGDDVPPRTIDTALTEAGGFRMGPLELADMIGHDVNYAVACSVYEAYDRQTRFRPQESQRALFDAGHLGRKSGRGVYDYGSPLPPPPHLEAYAPPAWIAASKPGLIAPLVDAARSANIPVRQDAALPRETLSVDGVILALGDGRRLAHRPGVDGLLDFTRDFDTAKTLAITAANAGAAAPVAGFLQAIGRNVLALPDRPGQLVLRTLAQLANAAADAVIDDVASAQGIDDALRFGANHPEGPLAWARRVGLGRVGAILDNLAADSGDDSYRPSSFFAHDD